MKFISWYNFLLKPNSLVIIISCKSPFKRIKKLSSIADDDENKGKIFWLKYKEILTNCSLTMVTVATCK